MSRVKLVVKWSEMFRLTQANDLTAYYQLQGVHCYCHFKWLALVQEASKGANNVLKCMWITSTTKSLHRDVGFIRHVLKKKEVLNPVPGEVYVVIL